MKRALIIVGDGLKYNNLFVSYLKRKVGVTDLLLYIERDDENSEALVQDTIARYPDVVVAYTERFGMNISDICRHSHVQCIPIKEGEEIDSVAFENEEVGMYLIGDGDEVRRFESCIATHHKSEIVEGLWYIVTSTPIDSQRCIEEQGFRLLIGDELSFIIADRLMATSHTVTFAESCTGGLIASELVKNSGVSSIFKGSIVSYANEIKTSLVGVREETLIKHGAVSEECVKEMLEGVMDRFDSDFSVAVSGIAGPDGGSLEKPVGTIIIGVKKRDKSAQIKRLLLKGDRIFIQQSTLYWALKLLVESDEKLFLKFLPKTLDK